MEMQKLIDYGKLSRSSDRVIDVVIRFAEQFPRDVEVLMEKLKSGDRTGARDGIHRLRGSATSCGFSEIGRVLEVGEDMLFSNESHLKTDELSVWMDQVRSLVKESSVAFSKFLKERNGK